MSTKSWGMGLLAVWTIAGAARAQKANGTVTAILADEGQNTGTPSLDMALAFSCTASCSELPWYTPKYVRIASTGDATRYESGSTSFIIGREGTGTGTSRVYPGANLVVQLNDVACSCARGGLPRDAADYQSFQSAVVHIPPHIHASNPNFAPVKFVVGEETYVYVSAGIFGTERLRVHVLGGGVERAEVFEPKPASSSRTLTSTAYSLTVTPSEPGSIVITASVEPGATSTYTGEVTGTALPGGGKADAGGTRSDAGSNGATAANAESDAGGCSTSRSSHASWLYAVLLGAAGCLHRRRLARV